MRVQKKGQQLRVPFSVMMTPLSCVPPPRNSTARNSLQCQKRVGSAETEHLSTVIQCSSLPRRLRNPLLHPPSPAPPPPPLSTLSWSIQRGNDGGLVTARSTPGLSRQSHPREAAPNWADAFFAAADANESQLALHPRGPAGLGFKKICGEGEGRKALYGNDEFVLGFFSSRVILEMTTLPRLRHERK